MNGSSAHVFSGKADQRAPRLIATDLDGTLLRPDGSVSVRTRRSLSMLAEIAPRGVTKASSLVEWCAERGISSADVWAFGDMPNDLPMLTWAGVSFAVANAHPDVAAAANMSCPSNAEDGLACVLETLAGKAHQTRPL